MSAPSKGTDLLVVGGGVLGLTMALEWKRRYPDQSITILEKESTLGAHASGRNSGVLHAGFYYTAESLKARFSKEGAAAWSAYCDEKDLPIHRCGKLVVTRDESEHPSLEELFRRGRKNGVLVQEVDEAEAKEIEPRVKTCRRALWSPTTATVDPKRIMARLEQDAIEQGILIRKGCRFLEAKKKGVATSDGFLPCGYVLNAAGLYADVIAKKYGFGEGLQILPFRGLYLYSSRPTGEFRTNLYPVPHLENPFLGVHFTVTVDGKAKIGPTAQPAFWRENYRGFDGFRFRELLEVLWTEAQLFFRAGFNFRQLAFAEIRKMMRSNLVKDAAGLATGVRIEDYTHWGPAGIRAQLLDLKTRKLVMDFLVEGDQDSFHVLNAISPAFTCAIPFASFCCDKMERFRAR